jgi:hypothetical protein
MTKQKTIKLSFPHAPSEAMQNVILYDGAQTQAERNARWEAVRRYRIEQVTDSIEFNPGDYLDREQVDTLCASETLGWKVTIVPNK